MPSEDRFPTLFATPDSSQDAGAFSNVAWPNANVSGHDGTSTTLSSVNSQRRRASIGFSGWTAPSFGSPSKGYVPPDQTLPTLYPAYNPDLGDTFTVRIVSITAVCRYQFLINNHDDADGQNLFQIEYSTDGGSNWSTLALRQNINESVGVVEAEPSASISTSLNFANFRMRERCDAFTSSGNERCGAVLGSHVSGGSPPKLSVVWEWTITFNPNPRAAQSVVIAM
jgi:hypothetical protein